MYKAITELRRWGTNICRARYTDFYANTDLQAYYVNKTSLWFPETKKQTSQFHVFSINPFFMKYFKQFTLGNNWPL